MDPLGLPTISCTVVPKAHGQDFRFSGGQVGLELVAMSCRKSLVEHLHTLECICIFSKDHLKTVGML